MRKEYLNLIICYHCKMEFKHGEEIYTIANRKFDDLMKQFHQQTIPLNIETSKGIFDVPSIERCLNFHSSCFAEIAGEDYLP